MTCLPATSATGTEQERTASRFTITVQAPHKPSPQPNLVPVSPRSLRNTQSSMRSSSTFTLAGLPLSVKEMVRSMKTSLLSDFELLSSFYSVAAGRHRRSWRECKSGLHSPLDGHQTRAPPPRVQSPL